MQNPSIVLYGAGSAKVEDKPIPEILQAHDVLVQIAFVGVCGSDVHFWNEGGIGNHVDRESGIVMGHEASGIVTSIGTAVTDIQVGDRVAIEPGLPCRHCKPCKAGTYHLCKNIEFAASPGPPATPGTLCKYYKTAEDFVYKIPENISLEEAVLVEPTSVAVHSVKLGDVRPGETVVVMGSGTIGLLCAAVAKEFGAHRVILVDILDTKLEFARNYLECETFRPSTDADAETNATSLLSTFGLAEVDTVIEASGAASSIETGINILRKGGKYVQTGIGRRKVEFPIALVGEKELVVKGCFRYSSGDYELAVSLLSRGSIDVKSLISSTSPFEDATVAWEKTKKGEGIKNLIRGVL
ncbi:GroES-like protein [Massarina eburnea CBS 473.64]|uniref:D-xylulose reductase n=1 Tax=Massarina eburnea CBS 473.64 TaxID=1395130 RepID=A0A6A6RUK5_9PLEO|nr:GroES-like protein [Massarina eburnea CBS 473.64]